MYRPVEEKDALAQGGLLKAPTRLNPPRACVRACCHPAWYDKRVAGQGKRVLATFDFRHVQSECLC